MTKLPVVYIMASKRNGTLYTGVTSNLLKRVYQHKEGVPPKSFTARYGCTLLVYYEQCPSMMSAIEREKAIKGGSRAKKIALITAGNPEWCDLFEELVGR